MATKRAWGDKSGGSGDPNILKLEDSTKIRLIDPAGKVEYKQHVVEHADDGDQTEFIVCPDDGNCPMCRKPEGPDGKRYFPRSRRFATNVWDFATNSVKVLIAGPQIFDKFDDAAEVGYDPTASDWTIHKSGQKKQTTYNTIRGDASAFTHEVGPDSLHDLDKYTQPESIEQIFEKIEKMGYDYDSLPVREFDEDSALAYVFAYGKCKGMTVEQVLAQDASYAEYMYNNKKSQGAYGDPLFLALHTVLEARGEVEALPEIDRTAGPPPKATTSAAVTGEAASKAPAEGEIELITPDGAAIFVPQEAVEGLLANGFTRPPEPEPEPEDPGEVELLTPTGDSITVPPDAVEGLLAAGFERPQEEPEPEEIVYMVKNGEEIGVPPATVKDMEAAGFSRKDAESAEPVITFPVTMQKDGAEVSAPDEGTMQTLEAAGFARVEQTPAEPEPPKRPEISDDTVFTVDAGTTTLPMKWAAIVAAVQGGAAFKITDNDEAQAELLRRAGEVASSAQERMHKDANSEANGGAPMEEPEQLDPEKPFKCEFCPKAFKTKGALTQHNKREHKDAIPAASSPVASNGGGGTEAKLEEVKLLIDKVPELQKDYDALLKLFEEVAGKRAISEFTDTELDALKVRLEGMAS